MDNFIRIIKSISRVIFVIVILLSLSFYALAISQICPPIDSVIIVFGPLVIGGIYWIWVGKKSTVAHKNFGMLFFYLFFSLSYFINILLLHLVQTDKEDFLLALSLVFFMISPFLLLAYFEEKARYYFSGKIELSKKERVFAYFFAPLLNLVFIGFAGSIYYILNYPKVDPEKFPDFNFLSYLIIIVIGFIASLFYSNFKKQGMFKLKK